MKKVVVLFLSAFFALTSQASATGYTSCANGDISVVGDSLYVIDLYEDGIGFYPYESHFSVDAADIHYDAGTFTIVNKTVTETAEGEESSVVINAILTLSADRSELNVAISEDKGAFRTHTLKCVEVLDLP